MTAENLKRKKQERHSVAPPSLRHKTTQKLPYDHSDKASPVTQPLLRRSLRLQDKDLGLEIVNLDTWDQ